MTLTPTGDVLLDSQADSELILVHKPDSGKQTAIQIPLSSPSGTPQVDDTVFTSSSDGFLLVADRDAETVYAISKAAWIPGSAYTAGNVGTLGLVARLDLESGQLTPIVTGLNSPHGMAFVRTRDEEDSDSQWDRHEDACKAFRHE
jgi:hypothetical protein